MKGLTKRLLTSIGLLLAFALIAPSLARAACSGPGAYGTAVCADSPTQYLRLNESSGTTATDSSGNSHNGAYTSSNVSYSVTGPTQVGEDGITLASGGYITAFSSYSTLGSADNLTWEIWFKTTATALSQIAGFSNGTNGYGGAYIGYPTAGQVECDYYALGDYATTASATTYNDGAWHLLDCTLVATGGSTALTAYVDGVASGSPQALQTLPMGLQTNYIGEWI